MIRKEQEIENCGFSLWAYSSPIANKILPFIGGTEEIYVVMVNSGKEIVGDSKKADNFYYLNHEFDKHNIPNKIITTYSDKANSAYALFVKEYYKINGDDNIFYKSNYERCSFFNGVELLRKRDIQNNTNAYSVAYVAKLRKPFNVRIE